MTLGGEMNIKSTAIGSLHEHISTPPALPICFDSSEGVTHPKWNSNGGKFTTFDFVIEVNTLAWGQCGELYPTQHKEEIELEIAQVGGKVHDVLSRWRNYGLLGTNIEGWFKIDPGNTDEILRAIALFGFVLWERGGEVYVMCGFHRNLGIHVFGIDHGMAFGQYRGASAVYVVVPTIYAELDHPSMQYLKYETLEID
jgi:hypothetical protein